MKKRLLSALIAGGIAAVGVGASLSTAIALYYVNPADHTIDVNIQTSSDVGLIIDYTAPETDYVFAPDKNISVAYKIRATNKGGTYTQPFVVGKLDVKITSSNQDFLKMLDYSNAIGYRADTYFLAERSEMTFGAVTDAGNGAYTVTGSMIAVSPVASTADEGLAVTLGMNKKTSTTDAQIAAVSDSSFSIEIDYSNVTDEEYAAAFGGGQPHVRGIDGVWSAQSEKYMMVPNIGSKKGLEFMWVAPEDITADAGGYKGTRITDGAIVWGGGENCMKVNIVAGDSIYWDGTKTGLTSFYHPTTV